MSVVDPEHLQAVAEYVRAKRNGMSVAEACRRADDLSQNKWRDVEKGIKPFRDTTLYRIAKGLGEPPQRLFELAGLPIPPEQAVDTLKVDAHSNQLPDLSREELLELKRRLDRRIDELFGEEQ